MTTYAFPSITPSSSTLELISNTDSFVSPFTGATQTIDRGGERWRITMSFNNLKTTEKAEMRAFLVKLNGKQHRFTCQPFGNDNAGTFGGTPLVAGASQTGTSLNIDGCTNSVTDWIKAGDFFSVDGKLKMAIADANSSGSGTATITHRPRTTTAPADNAAITTTNPTGVFMLEDPTVGWSTIPGDFSTFTITAIEDIT